MSSIIVLDPEAELDYEEGYNFYESRRLDLGEEFADAVEVVFDRIASTPKFYPIAYRHTRRGGVLGSPYCVYYQIESTHIRVVSVFHTSRDPKIWQSRI